MLRLLVRTADDVAPLIARLALGVMIFPHGSQKVLGWFGGPGLAGATSFLTGTVHLPYALALVVIAAEFLGGLGLVVGLLGRVAALGVFADMLGAVVTTHLRNGFFMNWSGQQAGEGFEFHLLALALALIVVLKGSGRLSIDRVLTTREARATMVSRRA